MSRGRPPSEFYERLWRGDSDSENRSRWSFQAELAERALGWLGEVRESTVLEVGPGAGRETAALVAAGARVVALDVTLASLARTRAAAGPGALLLLAVAERLPLLARSLDRVFAQTVLMHLDYPAAAAEWARVLRPGGRVVLLEPVRGNPLVWLYRRFRSPYRETHPRYLSVAEIAAAPPRLRVVRTEVHFLLSVAAIGLPGPLASAIRPPLAAVDRVLLRLPWLRRFAWMALVELERVPEPAHEPSTDKR